MLYNDNLTLHNKRFGIGAVLQKRSGEAEVDPGRKEKGQPSNSGSLAPESSSDQQTQKNGCTCSAQAQRPHLVAQTCWTLVKYRNMKTWQRKSVDCFCFFFFFKVQLLNLLSIAQRFLGSGKLKQDTSKGPQSNHSLSFTRHAVSYPSVLFLRYLRWQTRDVSNRSKWIQGEALEITQDPP